MLLAEYLCCWLGGWYFIDPLHHHPCPSHPWGLCNILITRNMPLFIMEAELSIPYGHPLYKHAPMVAAISYKCSTWSSIVVHLCPWPALNGSVPAHGYPLTMFWCLSYATTPHRQPGLSARHMWSGIAFTAKRTYYSGGLLSSNPHFRSKFMTRHISIIVGICP